MFLVLLAKVVQTWKQGLFLVNEDDATPLAYLKIGDCALQPLLYGCCTKVNVRSLKQLVSLLEFW